MNNGDDEDDDSEDDDDDNDAHDEDTDDEGEEKKMATPSLHPSCDRLFREKASNLVRALPQSNVINNDGCCFSKSLYDYLIFL